VGLRNSVGEIKNFLFLVPEFQLWCCACFMISAYLLERLS
jgi:hypothetical protein